MLHLIIKLCGYISKEKININFDEKKNPIISWSANNQNISFLEFYYTYLSYLCCKNSFLNENTLVLISQDLILSAISCSHVLLFTYLKIRKSSNPFKVLKLLQAFTWTLVKREIRITMIYVNKQDFFLFVMIWVVYLLPYIFQIKEISFWYNILFNWKRY